MRKDASSAIVHLLVNGEVNAGKNILAAMNLFDPSEISDFIKLLNFLALEPIENNNDFCRIIQAIGIPLYFNKKNEFGTFGENWVGSKSLANIYALFGIKEYLTKGEYCKTCPYIQECDYSDDAICGNTPWKRQVDNNGCSYSIMWKMFGFPESI